MVASAAKKMPSKSSKSTEKVAPKTHYSTHPPWTDMITECITTTADGARHGVSRPVIKKFVDSKYHLRMDAAATSQLNRAIAHGTLSGNFTLPKGPSGKVMLAPKRVTEIAKENKKPPSSRPAVRTAKKAPVSTPKARVPPFTEEQHPKTMPATRKYTSRTKKARVTPTPGRRVPARKAVAKRGGAKRTLTGSSAITRSATRRGVSSKRRTSK